MSNGNDRHQKALAILRRGGVVRQNNDLFVVAGNSGSDWKVTVWDDKHIQCSCPVSKLSDRSAITLWPLKVIWYQPEQAGGCGNYV